MKGRVSLLINYDDKDGNPCHNKSFIHWQSPAQATKLIGEILEGMEDVGYAVKSFDVSPPSILNTSIPSNLQK